MAERLFRQEASGRHEARSAGADPHRETAEPAVVTVLREVGIDASDHHAHRLDAADIAWADVVIAACDGACPVVTRKRYENWALPDPHGRDVDEVRAIRDEIIRRVESLLHELG